MTESVWDPTVSVVRWFAFGYGLYLLNRLLPLSVAAGRTRREFLGSVARFVAGAGAVLAPLLVWTTIGLLLAAGFYRSGGSELVAVVLALAMVVVTGYGIGFSGLPFVGAVVDVADVPLAGTLALCLAGLLPGAAATWALVRDLPIRNP